jgi:glycosyltransferase involved in cell wall biosynthesis
VKSDALRVAVVHEWLVDYSGSERVVEQILRCFPQADLYSVVDFLPDDARGFLGGRRAHTSFIQKLPGAKRHFRRYLPLMPLAVEQFDLRGYDLILSSSHAVSKGVISGPDQVHISYVHSPMRYAWDLQHEYLREAGLARGLTSWATRAVLHYLRLWDVRTAHGVDQFVANSAYIARRIRKVYRRESSVVYPPVDVARFRFQAEKEPFYLAASRLVPYKRMPLIVEAFARMPDRRLVVVGDGPDMARVRALAAAAPNIEVLGFQPNEALAALMARAQAFVFAAEEDFGITPVELQACGTPVIAYGAGGAVETVVDDPDPAKRTGVLFDEQTADALCAAVQRFERLRDAGGFDPRVCRANAERFGIDAFAQGLCNVVDQALAAQGGKKPRPPVMRPLLLQRTGS